MDSALLDGFGFKCDLIMCSSVYLDETMMKQLISALELIFLFFVSKKLLSKNDKQNLNLLVQMTYLIPEQRL